MMLRPCARISHTACWKAVSVASTTAPGKPRSPISSTNASRRRRFSAGSSPANSVNSNAAGSPCTKRSTTARNIGMSRDRSIIARVDQLDRAGAELDDPPGRRHRAVEAREMADAERPVGRDRLQFELDLVEEGEGALRADEHPRHVVAGIVDAVDIVTADPPENFRKPLLDLLGLAPVQRAHAGHELAIALR